MSDLILCYNGIGHQITTDFGARHHFFGGAGMSPEFDSLMQSLSKAEKQSTLPCCSHEPITYYRQYGDWYINEQFIAGNLRVVNLFSPPAIPGLSGLYYPSLNCKSWVKKLPTLSRKDKIGSDLDHKENMLGLILGWPLAAQKQSNTQADIIYVNNGVKNRLRSIYFSKFKASMKMGLGASNVNRIKNEIATVNNLTKKIKNTSISIPRILDYHVEEEMVFFLDELVLGKVLPQNNKSLLHQLLTFMWQLYADYGIKLVDVAEILPPEKTISNLEEVIETLKERDYQLYRGKIIHQCSRFLYSDLKIPCSFVHGDLKRKNVLVNPTNNQVKIIDWESAAEKPLIKDYIYLFYEYPAFQKFIKSFLTAACKP